MRKLLLLLLSVLAFALLAAAAASACTDHSTGQTYDCGTGFGGWEYCRAGEERVTPSNQLTVQSTINPIALPVSAARELAAYTGFFGSGGANYVHAGMAMNDGLTYPYFYGSWQQGASYYETPHISAGDWLQHTVAVVRTSGTQNYNLKVDGVTKWTFNNLPSSNGSEAIESQAAYAPPAPIAVECGAYKWGFQNSTWSSSLFAQPSTHTWLGSNLFRTAMISVPLP